MKNRTRRLIHFGCVALILISVVAAARKNQQANLKGSKPSPEPAIHGILAAFDRYEVVAMPEAHGQKDIDDFILLLIRNPAFWEKVNDIEVECGNSLYQGTLDRYMGGEDVPWAEVRKVWRNTTAGPMCDTSGFFEQFFPLVRAINEKLPTGKRLRVLAGDPPIDWDQIKTVAEIDRFLEDRDSNIASVMEKEVLSKHRKALMLFGTFHLMHKVSGSAVAMYEKEYPNVTFVVSDLGIFDADLPARSGSPFVTWPVPSLARAKGTWLGGLDLSHFFPPPLAIDDDCKVHNEFPKELQKPMEELVDAFLYLGPQDLRLKEQMPADIALDADYITESQKRAALQGFPGAGTTTLKGFDQRTVNGASSPLLVIPKPPNPKAMVQRCLDLKSRGSTQK